MSASSRPRYRRLDHTSDLKAEIYGACLPELFANAAFYLFDTMVDLPCLGAEQTRTVELESPNLEELLLDWLRELLFLFSTRSFAVARVDIGTLVESNPCRLVARLYGDDYDPGRHGLNLEIKTPTYHQYELDRTADGYRATIVFDV